MDDSVLAPASWSASEGRTLTGGADAGIGRRVERPSQSADDLHRPQHQYMRDASGSGAHRRLLAGDR